MTLPTPFEKMRRNRPKLVKARETLRERINRIELEMTSGWELTTVQMLNDARHQERLAKQAQPQRQPAARSFWPFRRAAA